MNHTKKNKKLRLQVKFDDDKNDEFDDENK